jgi:WD40 repeat protein
MPHSAQTKYLVTGAADNTMRLWDVRSGKCLYVWEFLTAVKRVAWRWVPRRPPTHLTLLGSLCYASPFDGSRA